MSTSAALTPRPPLGWNSYDCYGCSANQRVIRSNLEAFARKLKPAGCEYFVIDNGWFADIAVTPAGEVPEYYIDPEKLYFVKQSLPDGDCLRPWHGSPVAISGIFSNSNGIEETISLVPFGCTVLRQTTFKTDNKSRS